MGSLSEFIANLPVYDAHSFECYDENRDTKEVKEYKSDGKVVTTVGRPVERSDRLPRQITCPDADNERSVEIVNEDRELFTRYLHRNRQLLLPPLLPADHAAPTNISRQPWAWQLFRNNEEHQMQQQQSEQPQQHQQLEIVNDRQDLQVFQSVPLPSLNIVGIGVDDGAWSPSSSHTNPSINYIRQFPLSDHPSPSITTQSPRDSSQRHSKRLRLDPNLHAAHFSSSDSPPSSPDHY